MRIKMLIVFSEKNVIAWGVNISNKCRVWEVHIVMDVIRAG